VPLTYNSVNIGFVQDIVVAEQTTHRRRWRLLFLKLALAVVFVLIGIQALQLLIPALQYRDDVLRLLHYSFDCHAPCFMGITPGKTTKEEVFAILDNHPDVTRYDEFGNKVSVYWRGYDSWPRLNITWEDNVVSRTGFMEYIPLVAFIAVMGFPDGDSGENTYAYVDEATWVSMDCRPSYFEALTYPSYIYFTTPQDVSFNNLKSHKFYLNRDCSWAGPFPLF
jgi:hypothetical protein